MSELITALKAHNCAHYEAPKALVAKCVGQNEELISLLIVALKEEVSGTNAGHDGGACSRLLEQALTGYSPEQNDAQKRALEKAGQGSRRLTVATHPQA